MSIKCYRSQIASTLLLVSVSYPKQHGDSRKGKTCLTGRNLEQNQTQDGLPYVMQSLINLELFHLFMNKNCVAYSFCLLYLLR